MKSQTGLSPALAAVREVVPRVWTPSGTVLRRAGVLLLVVLTGVACVRLFPNLNDYYGGDRFFYGWDLKVVCNSLDALRSGQDPYLYPRPLPLPYSVLHVYLLAPLCATAVDPIVYVTIYIAIALISAVALWRIVPATAGDRIAVLVAIFISFNSFPWQIYTGNVAIVELPLAVATVCLLAARKYHWAGAAFGLLASLKILPFFGVIAFLFLPAPNRARVQSIAFAAGSFLAIHLLNAILFSQWLPSYLAHLMGRIPGGADYEVGGLANQDTIDFVIDGFHAIGLDQPIAGFAIACLGLGVGWLTTLACASKGPDRTELPPVAVVSLIVLVLWLFLFRQKNYAFETFIPFMIAAGYGVGRNTAVAAIAASIILPSVFSPLHHVLRAPYLINYYQLEGAWAAALVILVGAVLRARSPKHQHEGITAIAN